MRALHAKFIRHCNGCCFIDDSVSPVLRDIDHIPRHLYALQVVPSPILDPGADVPKYEVSISRWPHEPPLHTVNQGVEGVVVEMWRRPRALGSNYQLLQDNGQVGDEGRGWGITSQCCIAMEHLTVKEIVWGLVFMFKEGHKISQGCLVCFGTSAMIQLCVGYITDREYQ